MSTTKIKCEDWGVIDGKPVQLFTLTCGELTMRVTNYGCIVTSLSAPDRDGNVADIVLGFDDLAGYIKDSPYFGAICGRVANRIRDGWFELGGTPHQLALNHPDGMHLHGGHKGFDKHVWEADPFEEDGAACVRFSRVSLDGEEAYPGELAVIITYKLSAQGWTMAIEAAADAPTHVNICQHTYWNLAGHDSGSVKDHTLQIAGEQICQLDEGLIATGEMLDVAGTPFDFREAKPIGQDLLKAGGDPAGYDVNYAIAGEAGTLRRCATAIDPASGRRLEVETDQPGVQLYTGNFLDGTLSGKGGAAYPQHGAFCLETQGFPNACNVPSFPSTLVKPGDTYRHTMVCKLGVE